MQLLRSYGRRAPTDTRDLEWSLAPYHDCASRLGLDPIALFEDAAEAAPRDLRRVVRAFGRAAERSPEAFGGYELVDTPDGLAYRWTERPSR